MSEPFILRKDSDREREADRVRSFLVALPRDKAWRVEFHEHHRTRSDSQNRYLHGVCYKTLGDAIGYEIEEVAEFLCGTYFGWKEKRVPKKPSNPGGVESVPVRTTTTDGEGKRSVLTPMEFSDYVAFVQRFAAEKGIFIPDPETIQ